MKSLNFAIKRMQASKNCFLIILLRSIQLYCVNDRQTLNLLFV